MELLIFFSRFLKLFFKSSKTGVANSAPAVGVGALTSATKSIKVKSVSCPTAEIIGISDLKTSRTKSSSLNGNKSSNEPPPRAIIIISGRFILSALKYLIPAIISREALSPCTALG